MAKIFYQRVSTAEQNLSRQEDASVKIGVERTFTDKASGKNAERAGLNAMLDFIREGDVLYIESISRLGRNVKDLLTIVETLEAKGVQLISQKEKIDTSTAMGKCLFQIVAAMAEMERSALLERQREGIASAKQRGKSYGRPKAAYPLTWEAVYGKWKQEEITAASAMKELKLTRTTFYKLVKQWESKVA